MQPPRPTPARTTRGRGAAAAGALAAALVAAGVALRLAGAEQLLGARGVQAMAFTVPALIAAGGVALVQWITAGGHRARLLAAAVTTAALLVGVLQVAPRGVAVSTVHDADGSDVITVATLNLLGGAADPAAVVELARDVDLLALQELAPPALAALDAAGLGAELPHRVVDVRPGAAGSGTFSRHPLQDDGSVPGTFAMPRVRMAHPSRPDLDVGVLNVHVVPPVDGAIGTWADELATIADGADAAIVLGDFNATLDHAAMRGVLDRGGYLDVAAAAGEGLRPTWPARGSRLPGVAIDHVLLASGNAGASSAEVRTVPGTDHRAVVARVVLPLRL